MAKKTKHSAFSIIELLIVIMIIASLTGLAIPAINMIQKSYNSTGSKNMISTALSTARTIAMNRQRYAGIRFQKTYDPDIIDPDNPLKQNQYMIPIVEDHENTDLVWGFVVVEGQKPIKLPENIGVMDMTYISDDTDIDEPEELTNATAFSIIFSPSGKLIIRKVWIRNKDYKEVYPDHDNSTDDVFNTENNVTQANSQVGMFIRDDSATAHLKQESSRNGFVIYDRKELAVYFNQDDAYSEYLEDLKDHESIYINAYTGSIIKK